MRKVLIGFAFAFLVFHSIFVYRDFNKCNNELLQQLKQDNLDLKDTLDKLMRLNKLNLKKSGVTKDFVDYSMRSLKEEDEWSDRLSIMDSTRSEDGSNCSITTFDSSTTDRTFTIDDENADNDSGNSSAVIPVEARRYDLRPRRASLNFENLKEENIGNTQGFFKLLKNH